MEFHEVVRLVSTVSTHASKVLSEALAKPRTGDWLALVDDEALQAHSAMEQALREVRELKRKVSEDAPEEAYNFLSRCDNTFEYSLATITPRRGDEPAEAHTGRAGSANRQLTYLVKLAGVYITAWDENEAQMRDYFESGCLCILKDKTLQKAPAEMSNEDAVKLYMDNCKCSRHPEHGLRKG